MPDLHTLAYTCDLIGKLMVSFTAIMVHHRFLKEHKIDEVVLREMRREQLIGLVGVAFLISGYIFHLMAL